MQAPIDVPVIDEIERLALVIPQVDELDPFFLERAERFHQSLVIVFARRIDLINCRPKLPESVAAFDQNGPVPPGAPA